ncbi:GFA family protein [Kaarinaea lacus]
MTINGSCFCGAVRYKIEGKLRDAASCHCSMCRKMFSSQASAYALFDPDEFTWLTGEDLLTHYETGNDFGIKFCSKCGSTLGGTYKGKPSWVTLGCIEGDPHIELGKHIFVGSKAAWETIPEGVVQYEAWPPENA